MSNNSLNICTGNCQVLSRIKVIRMSLHNFTDTCCQTKTKVRVDVDLANCRTSCFTKLIFRNTDSIFQLTAVGVDDLNVFLRN